MSKLDTRRSIVKKPKDEYKYVHKRKKCHSFLKSALLKNHVRPHYRPLDTFHCTKDALEPYSCKRCNFKTDLMVFLKQHSWESHPKFRREKPNFDYAVTSYICNSCNFGTYSSLQWLRHTNNGCFKTNRKKSATRPLASCKEIVWFERDDFSSELKFKTSFQRHYSICEDSRLYKCNQCSYKGERHQYLKSHLRKHRKRRVEDTYKEFQCPHCSYSTEVKARLTRHVMCKHTASEDIKWYNCDKCSFKAKFLSNLKAHKKLKHDDSDWFESFECQRCTFKTNRNSNLRRHFNKRHAGKDGPKWVDRVRTQNILKSDASSLKTDQNGVLRNDVKAPKIIKWFDCSHCEFRTKYKTNLQTHVWVKHQLNQEWHVALSTKFNKCQ